jgi:hypothetical protein
MTDWSRSQYGNCRWLTKEYARWFAWCDGLHDANGAQEYQLLRSSSIVYWLRLQIAAGNRDEEWRTLLQPQNENLFHSHAVQQSPPLYIELSIDMSNRHRVHCFWTIYETINYCGRCSGAWTST